MISKTVKTILFASLIAAMILPFSGMTMAEASMSDVTDKVKDSMKKVEKKIDRAIREAREAPDPPSQEMIDNMKPSGDKYTYGFKNIKDGFVYPRPNILSNSDNSFGTVIDAYTSSIDAMYTRNEVHDSGLVMADATALYAPTFLLPNKSGLEVVTSYVDEGTSTGTLKRVVLFDMSADEFITESAKTINSSFMNEYTEYDNGSDYYYSSLIHGGDGKTYALIYNFGDSKWEPWGDVSGSGTLDVGWVAWEETYMGTNGCPTSLPEINADTIKVYYNDSWQYATNTFAGSTDTGSICGVTQAVFDSLYFDWRVDN